MNKIIAERYELLDVIGRGGMADVYLANDTILNRTIAIKILRTSLAKDPVYIARFQREASAAAALSHKNIVEIYDEYGKKYTWFSPSFVISACSIRNSKSTSNGNYSS